MIMITKSKFEEIKKIYGRFSTWAIWDENNESDTEIIENNIDKLHTNWIIIGLNISKPVGVWGNFRGGKHDRKIKTAFSNTNILGSYMTDLIKKSEKSSTEIEKEVKQGNLDISEQVKSFVEEVRFVGVNDKTKFIIFGDTARNLYDEYYERHFPENKVYYLKHYSSRGTDKDWVEKVWDRLNIDLEFNNEQKSTTHNIA